MMSTINAIKAYIEEHWDAGEIETVQSLYGFSLIRVRQYLLVEDPTWYWWQDGTEAQVTASIKSLLSQWFQHIERIGNIGDTDEHYIEPWFIVGLSDMAPNMQTGLFLRACYYIPHLRLIGAEDVAAKLANFAFAERWVIQ